MKNESRKTIMYEKDCSRSKVKSQMVAKLGVTPRKVMLCMCVWWDWKGIVHYELLSVKRLILTSTVNNWKDYAK